MLSTILLFTGEEKYLLQQELQRRISGFVQKYGTDALFSFTGDRFDLGQVRQAIYSGGLFVQKKMVIIYGIPTDSDTSNKLPASEISVFADEFISKVPTLSQDTFVVFVSYKPDKRTKFFTFLSKEATVKTFEPLKPLGIKQFVREKTPGFTWTDDLLEYFLSKVGSDLYHIVHECEKLQISCALGSSLSKELIDQVSFGLIDANAFAFFDILLVDKKKALALVESVQEQGIHWVLFLGTLYWGFKMWILILDAYEQGITDSKLLASSLKIHPFVAAKIVKNISVVRSFSPSIRACFAELIDVDAGIKSGRLQDTFFWLLLKKIILQHF